MENQVSTIVCPNCGASTTNHMNCEYCGSLLVRFEDKQIPLDLLKYGKDGFYYPGLAEEFKLNLELQEKSPASMTCTDIDEHTGTINLQVVRRLSGEMPDEKLAFEDTGLEIFLRFTSSERERWMKFKKLDIFELFTVGDVEEIPDVKECRIDFGRDYESAARMISTIMKDVYGMDESTEIKYHTWNDTLNFDNTPSSAQSGKSGCAGMFLVMISAGFALMWGVSKIISIIA